MKSVKILYLIRHAKSSWEHNLEDFERPLKKRGINDANLVSKYLITSSIKPNLILSSGAKRARNTADIFVKNLNLEGIEFKINNAIYDFSGEGLLNVLSTCENSIDELMVFGHNYALTNIANRLGSIAIDNITTSGFVEIHFEANSWSNIKNGITKRIVFPKHLK